MINYSFIIPHKNTPYLLQKCLDSIPRRDDVQIIVVDDNSDADKVDFDSFPGLYDSSVEVYLTKEGKGAGYARNVGLRHAVGKWLVFADADDYFNNDINLALDKFLESDYQIIFFKTTSVYLDSGMEATRHLAINERIDRALNNGETDELIYMSYPISKFINRQFVLNNNISFQEVRWANDVMFSTKCALALNRYYISTIPLYCITSHSGSLVKDSSVMALLTRCQVDCESSRLIKAAGKTQIMSYWTYQTWLALYKKSKSKGLVLVLTLVEAIGLKDFITYSYKEVRHSTKKKIKQILHYEHK